MIALASSAAVSVENFFIIVPLVHSGLSVIVLVGRPLWPAVWDG
jgi:hypothetical protein